MAPLCGGESPVCPAAVGSRSVESLSPECPASGGKILEGCADRTRDPFAKNAQHPGSRQYPRCPWCAHCYNCRRRRSAGCHLSAVQVSTWQCPSRFCTGRRGVPPVRTDRREGFYVGETICANSVKQLCHEEGADHAPVSPPSPAGAS